MIPIILTDKLWKKAFDACGLTFDDYTRERGKDEVLPWDFIDTTVLKEYLWKERENGLKEKTTKNCREGCNACGANQNVKCVLAKGGKK